MFEEQMATLQDLNSKASLAIVDYYKFITNKGKDKEAKIELIEIALANIDILTMYIIQVRYEMREQLATIPASSKHQAYDCLDELRTIQDAAKTVAYNLTAAMHSTRDLLKVDLQ